MTLSSDTKCPYCLKAVPSKVEVCSHCTRDIGRLMKAEARIRELESLVADQMTLDRQLSTADPWVFRIPLWSFYVLSILSLVAIDPAGGHHEYVVSVLAMIAGIVIVALSGGFNIWTLFLVGFAQPFIATIVLFLFRQVSLESLRELLPEFFLVSCQTGAAAAFGGLLALVVGKRRLLSEYFSLTPLLDWMATTESRLDRAERFILKVAALVAALTLLLSRFQSASQ